MKPTRHYGKLRIRALEMVRDGSSFEQIGRALHVSANVARTWANAAGLRSPVLIRREEKRAAVLQRLQRGDSYATIARDVHVSYATIHRVAKAAGVDRHAERRAQRRAQVAALRAQGVRVNRIAIAIGCSRKCVQSDLKALRFAA